MPENEKPLKRVLIVDAVAQTLDLIKSVQDRLHQQGIEPVFCYYNIMESDPVSGMMQFEKDKDILENLERDNVRVHRAYNPEDIVSLLQTIEPKIDGVMVGNKHGKDRYGLKVASAIHQALMGTEPHLPIAVAHTLMPVGEHGEEASNAAKATGAIGAYAKLEWGEQGAFYALKEAMDKREQALNTANTTVEAAEHHGKTNYPKLLVVESQSSMLEPLMARRSDILQKGIDPYFMHYDENVRSVGDKKQPPTSPDDDIVRYVKEHHISMVTIPNLNGAGARVTQKLRESGFEGPIGITYMAPDASDIKAAQAAGATGAYGRGAMFDDTGILESLKTAYEQGKGSPLVGG